MINIQMYKFEIRKCSQQLRIVFSGCTCTQACTLQTHRHTLERERDTHTHYRDTHAHTPDRAQEYSNSMHVSTNVNVNELKALLKPGVCLVS